MDIFGLLMGLLLLLHRSAQTEPGIDHEFVHVEANLSWEAAQIYCRLRYEDLFTVWHENDLKNLTRSAKNLSWIGLYKGDQSWKWVDESYSEYFNWHKPRECASITKKGFWYSRSCNDNLAFVCKQFPKWDLETLEVSWSSAKYKCEQNSEKLAILHSATENGNVTAVLREKEAWIGLTKDTQSNWKWVDENPLIYSNWLTLFLCAVMDCNGLWHDTSCFEMKPFVCSGNIDGNATYELVSESKTWREAKSHCKLLKDDKMQLAILKTNNDSNSLLDQICKSKERSFSFWIGLYNDPWRWSSGSSYIKNWNSMQPDEKDFGDESVSHCAAILDGEWFVEDCQKNLSFFCSVTVRSMILVSEPKSWEEALDHCRDKYVDLASMGSNAEQKVAMRKIEDVQSGYVWTGLRFLAGSWFWVYGDGLQYVNWLDGEQQQCPDVTHRCGALAVSSGKWELRSCEEKLEFLCFQK